MTWLIYALAIVGGIVAAAIAVLFAIMLFVGIAHLVFYCSFRPPW